MKIMILKLTCILNLLQAMPADVVKDITQDEFFNLSVAAQNAHHKKDRLLQLTGDIEPGLMEENFRKLDLLFDAMVKKNSLKRKVFKLLPPKELDRKEGLELIVKFVDKISKKYGYYTSLEMLGLGVKFNASIHNKEQPIEIVIHLPQDLLVNFDNYLVKHQLLFVEAETDGR
jgi:hypothetical protein